MEFKTHPEREEYVIDTVLKPLGIGLKGITRHRDELNKPDEKDAADQKSRERNLRFDGFPGELDLDYIKDRLVTLIKNRLKLKEIEPSHIGNVYWIGKKQSGLIVSFTSKEIRDLVYQRRKRTSLNTDTKNIYIKEDLTLFRRKLLYEAREQAKAKKIHAAWSQNGTVFVKRTEDDLPTAVYNHKQLAEACKK